jgi:hypothetical protein
VVDVGGDDHAPGRDLVAHLLGGEVRLALGDALHLGRDHAMSCELELSSLVIWACLVVLSIGEKDESASARPGAFGATSHAAKTESRTRAGSIASLRRCKPDQVRRVPLSDAAGPLPDVVQNVV